MTHKSLTLSVMASFVLGPILVVVGCGGSADSPAIEAVKRAMAIGPKRTGDFQEAPLEGGTAVLVNDSAAFWVKDGEVYYANSVARSWAPTLKSAPDGVDLGAVRRAVRGVDVSAADPTEEVPSNGETVEEAEESVNE